ncbi:hypothetical protein C1I98_00560 [Spongiactinospora gelatinilytica]|uniref:Sensor histidine kinase n=1 Tax=Spongiactinospora gelatinilytica TaxID=2666298 RepID=A0A2W2H8N6_9ACTN|nr:hypothetical protein [Spongiactinospora gelatinilytica]PZG57021.1 hypothetical protein C1I98_00560 [Spongiactinospora gelatinilytica]
MRNRAPDWPAAGRVPGDLPPSGTGLLGLRQRVDLVGGVFSAQPTGDGGFELLAVLPGKDTAPPSDRGGPRLAVPAGGGRA